MEIKKLIDFVNQSPDFAHGFECGLLYAPMRVPVPELNMTVHIVNLEQIKVMALEMGYSIVSITGLSDVYAEIKLQHSNPASLQQ